MIEWLRISMEPAVRRRGLVYAVVVGAVLIIINHSDAVLRGDLDGPRILRMGLTVMVPYLVSTMSSVGAIRNSRRRGGGGGFSGGNGSGRDRSAEPPAPGQPPAAS